MKDLLKFVLKCLLAPFFIVCGMGIAGQIFGIQFKDSDSE